MKAAAPTPPPPQQLQHTRRARQYHCVEEEENAPSNLRVFSTSKKRGQTGAQTKTGNSFITKGKSKHVKTARPP